MFLWKCLFRKGGLEHLQVPRDTMSGFGTDLAVLCTPLLRPINAQEILAACTFPHPLHPICIQRLYWTQRCVTETQEEVEYANCVTPGSLSLSEAERKVPPHVFTRIDNATVATALQTSSFLWHQRITEKLINIFPLTPDFSPKNRISAMTH